MNSSSDGSNIYRVTAAAPNFADLSAGAPRLTNVAGADPHAHFILSAEKDSAAVRHQPAGQTERTTDKD